MGTPDFSVATLQALLHHPLVELCLVVSMPDRPAGRGQQLQSPAVIEYCKEHQIPFYQTENINKDQELVTLAQKLELDIIIVLAFAQFLNKTWLKMAKLGCFNIHTSLLPLYRGAAPIQYALLNGETKTGVTIQEMVSKMDAGDIVYQSLTDISPDETGGSLTLKLKDLAASTCHDFINDLSDNKCQRQPQDHQLATFAPTLDREMGRLNFQQQTAQEIERLVRALHPWPGTFCFLNGKRCKIFQVELVDHTLTAGQSLVTGNNHFLVGTKSGTMRITSFQIEGKKITSDHDFFKTISDKTQYQLSSGIDQ